MLSRQATSVSFPLAGLLLLLPALLLFSRVLADITLIIIGAVFLYLSYRQKDWRWLSEPWFKLALLFGGYLLVLNTPFSHAPLESLVYSLFFLRWPLFAAALSWWLLATQSRQKLFLQGLVVTCLLIAADTGWQYVFGTDWFGIEAFSDDRLTGPFRNPVAGTLMLRVWYIAIFIVFFWHFSRHLTLFATMSAWFMGLILIFITGERMALMLFAAGGLVLLPAIWASYPGCRRWLVTGLTVMALIMMILIQTQPQTAARSIYSIGEKLSMFPESDYGRVVAGAWQVWQLDFWLGTGIHTYQAVCEQLGVFSDQNLGCTHPHNLYLELGAETGLIGLLLFILMLIAIYRQSLRQVIRKGLWLHAALSFSVLTVSFWPLTGGVSVLSNWIAALVWLGVGWVLAVSATPLPLPSRPIAETDH